MQKLAFSTNFCCFLHTTMSMAVDSESLMKCTCSNVRIHICAHISIRDTACYIFYLTVLLMMQCLQATHMTYSHCNIYPTCSFNHSGIFITLLLHVCCHIAHTSCTVACCYGCCRRHCSPLLTTAHKAFKSPPPQHPLVGSEYLPVGGS